MALTDEPPWVVERGVVLRVAAGVDDLFFSEGRESIGLWQLVLSRYSKLDKEDTWISLRYLSPRQTLYCTYLEIYLSVMSISYNLSIKTLQTS